MAAKRGPSYPAFGLSEAINKARQLYENDGRAQTSQDVVLAAWGYSSRNGASLRAYSAVRQFGLLDVDGERVRLSDTALAILLESPGSKDYCRALRDAANSPTVFRALFEEYPDELPSDATIIALLVRHMDFNPSAAKGIAESFRETAALVKECDAYDIPSVASKPSPSAATGGEAPSRVATSAARTPTAPGRDAPPERAVFMEFIWPLSGDAVATMTVSRSLDADDIDTLEAYFDIAKKALAKAAKARATAESREEGGSEVRIESGDD